MTKLTNKKGGFTLIELLVVIGIIAILAAIVIVSINPAKRFQDARNSQRQANVEAILGAIQQHTVDKKGTLCSEITLSEEAIDDDEANLMACLSDYLAVLPYDPSSGSGGYWTSTGDYDTGYNIQKNAAGQVTVSAPYSDDDKYDPDEDGDYDIISVTR